MTMFDQTPISLTSLKRKARCASVASNVERIHRYAPILEKVEMSPRERELIEDLLIVGDEQVVAAMEQFSINRDYDELRRILHGPAKENYAALEILSNDFATLEMSSIKHSEANFSCKNNSFIKQQREEYHQIEEDPLMMMSFGRTAQTSSLSLTSGFTFEDPMMSSLLNSTPPCSSNKKKSSKSNHGRPCLLFDDVTDAATFSFDNSSSSSVQHGNLSLESHFIEKQVLLPDCFMSISNLLEKKIPVRNHFTKEYLIGQEIGTGKYSIVKECTELKSGNKFAVKIIDKKQMMEVRFLKRELEIMYTLKHPGIVRLVELYENNEQLFIVMELCQQELFQVIDTKGPLQETIVQKLIQKLVETIAYLHQNAIVHRDIKPENILIVDKDIVSDIKLSDFGIARRLEGTASLLTPHESLNEVPSSSEPVRNREVRAHTKCGTRDYVAPEVMSGKGYGTIADMWSVGVVTFVLMSACAPVFLPGQGDVKQVHFGKEECWENASKEVKEFIVCLLERSPEKRMTATKALDHPWLKNVVETKNKST